MKRSRHIALLGMGVSTLVLAACGGDKVDTSTYASVQDCIAGKVLTESQCQRAFEVAIDVHDQTAPRFETQAQCEAVAGENKCERGPSPSSSQNGTSTNPTYRPSFLAFMVPHFGANPSNVQPLYPQKSAVGLAPAATIAEKAKVAGFNTHSPRVATLSRNGFGTTTTKSSWFSSSSS